MYNIHIKHHLEVEYGKYKMTILQNLHHFSDINKMMLFGDLFLHPWGPMIKEKTFKINICWLLEEEVGLKKVLV